MGLDTLVNSASNRNKRPEPEINDQSAILARRVSRDIRRKSDNVVGSGTLGRPSYWSDSSS